MKRLEATLTLAQAARRRWDVLVVGAGPAGALAARGLALRGAGVLLVDKATFPRWKICGCCLNGAAVATLAEAGLGHLLRELEAARLHEVRLMAGRRQACLRLPEGYSLSRERLDGALITEAIRAGVQFLPNTRARWETTDETVIHVRVDGPSESAVLPSRFVVAADGLTAGFTRSTPGVVCRQKTNARLGAGATFVPDDDRIEPGVIHMAIGHGGYVGMVRLEDGRLNIAAAFDSAWVKAAGGMHRAASCILAEAGGRRLPHERLLTWRGTPPLTRRYEPPVRGRLLLVGDAAGYVEPISGEGMAWALASGAAVVPVVDRALQERQYPCQRHWKTIYRRLLGLRQRRCRMMAAFLRRPHLTTFGIRVLDRMPSLADPYLHRLNRMVTIQA